MNDLTETAKTLETLRYSTEQMAQLRDVINEYANIRTDCVAKLRQQGYTLADIGSQLGVTPQAVAKIARRQAA